MDAFYYKIESHQRLRALLYRWKIPHIGCCNSLFHWVSQVGRFHLYAYWRPMTQSMFENLTLDYEGPYIPIFGSDKSSIERDEVIAYPWEVDERPICFRYQRVYPYFYCPAFVLETAWPKEHDWRWTPVVRITPKILYRALLREVVYGGWTKNSRGRVRVPYRTGTTGLSRVVENGGGWATYTPQCQTDLSIDREWSTDCRVSADLSVCGSESTTSHDSGQKQDDLFRFDAEANII